MSAQTKADLGSGITSYLLEGNENQPMHVMTGLFRYASEKALWGIDEDEED